MQVSKISNVAHPDGPEWIPKLPENLRNVTGIRCSMWEANNIFTHACDRNTTKGRAQHQRMRRCILYFTQTSARKVAPTRMMQLKMQASRKNTSRPIWSFSFFVHYTAITTTATRVQKMHPNQLPPSHWSHILAPIQHHPSSTTGKDDSARAGS